LVEKPLAATVEEAQDLTALASARGLVLQVGHVERFNSALRAAFGSNWTGPVREALQTPNLVECRRWAPFSARGADVDVVLDLMIHDLDIVLALVGAPVEDVQANGVRVVSATADVAHARVTFQNGCVASFSASRLASAKVREIRLYDADQFWVLDLLQQTALVGRRSVASPEGSPVVTQSLRGDHQDALRLELQAFVESVRAGTEPLVSGREGTAALELAFAIMDEIARHSTTISGRESHETTPHHYR
jgi:predicted dehydrogenase